MQVMCAYTQGTFPDEWLFRVETHKGPVYFSIRKVEDYSLGDHHTIDVNGVMYRPVHVSEAKAVEPLFSYTYVKLPGIIVSNNAPNNVAAVQTRDLIKTEG